MIITAEEAKRFKDFENEHYLSESAWLSEICSDIRNAARNGLSAITVEVPEPLHKKLVKAFTKLGFTAQEENKYTRIRIVW